VAASSARSHVVSSTTCSAVCCRAAATAAACSRRAPIAACQRCFRQEQSPPHVAAHAHRWNRSRIARSVDRHRWSLSHRCSCSPMLLQLASCSAPPWGLALALAAHLALPPFAERFDSAATSCGSCGLLHRHRWIFPSPLQWKPDAPAVGNVQCAAVGRALVAAALLVRGAAAPFAAAAGGGSVTCLTLVHSGHGCISPRTAYQQRSTRNQGECILQVTEQRSNRGESVAPRGAPAPYPLPPVTVAALARNSAEAPPPALACPAPCSASARYHTAAAGALRRCSWSQMLLQSASCSASLSTAHLSLQLHSYGRCSSLLPLHLEPSLLQPASRSAPLSSTH